MKFKGLILVILIVLVAVALLYLPETKVYKEIATIGSSAPDFSLRDFDGEIWKLSDLRGKVVYINFWATWCTVCKAEMTSKEKLKQMMQGKPLQMLGILFRDDPRNLPSYFENVPVRIPTLISPNDKAAALYGITGVPETFIIDKEGIIREKIVGPREWHAPENIALIEKWL